MLNKTQLFFDLVVVIILVRPLFYFDKNRSTVVTTNAFSVTTRLNRHSTKSLLLFSTIPTEPINNKVDYNYDRAEYCIDHFGTCTLAEMESIKNGFHQDRLQHLILGLDYFDPLLESSRTLEEELDIQITAIKKQNSITDIPSIFPNDEIENEVLPQLHNQHEESEGIFHIPTPTEVFVLEETILEENIMEPITICCIILGLALLPQLI